jgi:hypothetical protein
LWKQIASGFPPPETSRNLSFFSAAVNKDFPTQHKHRELKLISLELLAMRMQNLSLKIISTTTIQIVYWAFKIGYLQYITLKIRYIIRQISKSSFEE